MTVRWHDSEARRLVYMAVVKTRVEAERRVGAADGVKRMLTRPARRNLSWLAAVYGSDKGATAHRYVDLYERHLGSRRHRVRRVLEIGVYRGASLRMWRDYFPHAEIYGLDIKEVLVPGDRIHTLVGDQSDPALLAELRSLGPFDLIVDDGSHRAPHVLATFAGLYDALCPGGLYVIEDMHTSYWSKTYGGGAPGTDGTSAALVKRLVDAVNRDHVTDEFPQAAAELPPVAELHVYEKIAFVERGEDRL